MQDLAGKVAVVTGSASGLGRAMAERFSREGMTVVIADNRVSAADVVAKEIASEGGRAVAMEVDVTKRASVVALADRVDADLGGVHVLVNNAGVAAPSTYLEADEDAWRWVMEVNVFGVLYGIQTFVPRMLARGGEAHIVNTSSFGGLVGPNCFEGNRFPYGSGEVNRERGMPSYMVSKHAVVALSEGLAGNLEGTAIGVSVLCPAHHDNTGIYENSAKFRPAQFGGPNADGEKLAARSAKRRHEPAKDPNELAGRVVRAIRQGHFYIFSHPDNRFIVEQRFEQILAGFDDAASFTG
jgi:NAD(P)-dependent dehydrogenase (short-subunit alcohol dehydrogenase family)